MPISLHQVQESNTRISHTFPAGLVAIFIGATAGIGSYTLLELARCCPKSRIYFVGRSETDGARIKADCDRLNPGGKCVFIKKDTSLMKYGDVVCSEIRGMEREVNMLFMTQGTLDMSSGMFAAIPIASNQMREN